MKTDIYRQILDDDSIYSRQSILAAVRTVDPSFKETQLRYMIGVLYDSNLIVRIGHNQYRVTEEKANSQVFTGKYSHVAQQVIEGMQKRFPLLSFRVWELSWMNEFFNHLVSRNQIFLEVEKEGCDFVFPSLIEQFPGKVLLRPKALEVTRYGTENGIIINRLVTEAPKSGGEPYEVPLEKLIVDLFSNKNLLLPKSDYPSAIEAMFSTYLIDQVAMLRYARRRNRERDILDFLRNKTMVELLVQR